MKYPTLGINANKNTLIASYTCYVTQDLFHNKLKLTNSSFRTPDDNNRGIDGIRMVQCGHCMANLVEEKASTYSLTRGEFCV
jgi:hypothetical protein